MFRVEYHSIRRSCNFFIRNWQSVVFCGLVVMPGSLHRHQPNNFLLQSVQRPLLNFYAPLSSLQGARSFVPTSASSLFTNATQTFRLPPNDCHEDSCLRQFRTNHNPAQIARISIPYSLMVTPSGRRFRDPQQPFHCQLHIHLFPQHYSQSGPQLIIRVYVPEFPQLLSLERTISHTM